MFKSCPLKGAGGVGAIKDRVLKLVNAFVATKFISYTNSKEQKKLIYVPAPNCQRLSVQPRWVGL